jgi:isopenicillin N synthase-like dioxygenase
MDIRDFKDKGFVSVPYPHDLRTAVAKTAVLWKRFCALPVEVKKSLPYSNGGAGVGYELKDGTGPKADRKENFDATPEGIEWLAKYADQVGDPVALEFIRSAVDLASLLKPSIVEFAEAVESEFSIKGFAKETEESAGRYFVRFIHYFGEREEGEETATAHVDQSGFTPHVFQDEEGFEVLSYGDKVWSGELIKEGEMLIIPSMQMQLRSEGKLRALCHRVVATQKTSKSGRYSAVCFVQLKDTPKYDKDSHGRLQEKPPGFNYDMPFEQFRTLFK